MRYIAYYEDTKGNSEIRDLIKELERTAKTKDSRIKLGRIRNYTNYIQKNELHELSDIIVKHIEDGIWEMRPGNIRIFFYVLSKDYYILLNYFFKKTNKTPKREIEKALKIRNELLRRITND